MDKSFYKRRYGTKDITNEKKEKKRKDGSFKRYFLKWYFFYLKLL